MKVLLYSYVFAPSIGGIETVSETLARNLVKLGIDCIVITETIGEPDKTFPFEIKRNPSWKERIRLVKDADIIHSNGASLALFFYAKIARKPFIWTHGGYQLTCIDGLGWVEGEKAPLDPLNSFLYHSKKKGILFGMKEGVKLFVRRIAGKVVDKNVAITNWVAKRQPLRNQVVIYNPFPLHNFKMTSPNHLHKYDFIFVGRLVSEKGCITLLKAFKRLINDPGFSNKNLLMVGDGNWKQRLLSLSKELEMENNIYFVGKKHGKELVDYISQSNIAVVPSEWEEPMGGVALELMAAGKNIIVSRNGGLAECVGEAGLIFENGNDFDLYSCMKKMLVDTHFAEDQKKKIPKQLDKFDEVELTQQYLQLYKEVIRENGGNNK